MNIAHDKHSVHSPLPKAVIENRLCGDLFELKSAQIPPQGKAEIGFDPLINLVMTVVGDVRVVTDDSSFELSNGQVWLVNGIDKCEMGNLNDGDAVVMSVLIKSTMLSRFFERHKDNDSSKTGRPVNIVSDMLAGANDPVIFPSCELTSLTLESFRLFSQRNDDGLNALKLEELLLLKLQGDKGQILEKEMRSKNDPVQEKFRRFMEENVTQNWSISKYASSIGMSLTSFKNMFGQVYQGQSPKAWINERRLRYADLQLRTTKKRMIDIALESGFSSQSYFTQLYKTYYGISPSAARQ